MNEKGELLGIDEVRERLINDKPLILNPDANWNNLMSRTKEEYLYDYMAKNLYMLRCYVGKEKDSQGKVIPSAIELMPLDYFEQKPDKAEDVRYGFKCIIYKTNNSNKFWETP
jgi:hypothetical protein